MVLYSYAHDTRSSNRCHKSTPFFWRRFLVSVSHKSRTGFYWYQILALIRTLFCSKPESGVRMSEMMTCDWSMTIVDVLRCREIVLCSAVIFYLSNISDVFICSARNFHSRRTWNEKLHWKPSPISGARKWSWFMAPVSGACVTGFRP